MNLVNCVPATPSLIALAWKHVRGGEVPPGAVALWAGWWPLGPVAWSNWRNDPFIPFADPRGRAIVNERIIQLDPTLAGTVETASWEQLATWIAELDPEASSWKSTNSKPVL